MKVFTTPAEMRAWSRAERRDGRRVALVPTMGALHQGHLELIHVAATHGSPCASIFVNPMQFNRRDDFDAYPRTVDTDLDACREAGVRAVYVPTAAVMYPEGFQTTVVPGALAAPLEGAGRPGHFAGVTTVVSKLLHAAEPDIAVFGKKDYQQLAVIRRLVLDLDFGIEIIGVETAREADGLARSSRNRRLTVDDRAAAVCVPRALSEMAAAYARGERRTAVLEGVGRSLIERCPHARLEYLTVTRADTLEPTPLLGPELAVACAAVWFGEVRLIDNVELGQAT
jgi:pantoate--beta-alanine ligase